MVLAEATRSWKEWSISKAPKTSVIQGERAVTHHHEGKSPTQRATQAANDIGSATKA